MRGFYFSCGYYHTKEKELMEIVQQIPIEQILIETDSPYHLIEEPTRFILPKDIPIIAKQIADIKQVSVNELCKDIMKNARNLFSF